VAGASFLPNTNSSVPAHRQVSQEEVWVNKASGEN